MDDGDPLAGELHLFGVQDVAGHAGGDEDLLLLRIGRKVLAAPHPKDATLVRLRSRKLKDDESRARRRAIILIDSFGFTVRFFD